MRRALACRSNALDIDETTAARIVEAKSARRRSALRPASIWGDTDLKALVREAETEAPHLFGVVDRAGDFAPRQSAEACNQDGTRSVALYKSAIL